MPGDTEAVASAAEFAMRLDCGESLPSPSPATRLLADRPRIPLGAWPTPIEHVLLGDGREILVKRDDLSGYGRGGAKTRKLEYLLGHLVAGGYDELITVTGNVTNLVFDLLPALDRLRISARIFVVDYPRASCGDREQIFRHVLPRIQLLGRSRAVAAAIAVAAYARARASGRRPMLLLPGASHPSAALGNAAGFLEMAAQRRRAGAPLPGSVFVAVATGTTLAGFLLAAHALREDGWEPIRVIGVSLDRGATAGRTLGLVRWTERALSVRNRLPRELVEVVPLPEGEGFARFSTALPTLCERVQRDNGLRLDPIFSGRAWLAMEAACREDPPRAERPVLFWHCGYTPEWHTVGEAIRRGRREP